jgi:AraC-like DNA-binding protein
MKIADIGRRVGYDNTSYFIKKFQEKYGMTPEKYRMNPVE